MTIWPRQSDYPISTIVIVNPLRYSEIECTEIRPQKGHRFERRTIG